ncbi:hypothetical protein CGRA01v4_08896 [Colletotrichum graminicola]|nr:hypothetical protein CGRA01v4_08896 [Colletotrichum graminicola]
MVELIKTVDALAIAWWSIRCQLGPLCNSAQRNLTGASHDYPCARCVAHPRSYSIHLVPSNLPVTFSNIGFSASV